MGKEQRGGMMMAQCEHCGDFQLIGVAHYLRTGERCDGSLTLGSYDWVQAAADDVEFERRLAIYMERERVEFDRTVSQAKAEAAGIAFRSR